MPPPPAPTTSSTSAPEPPRPPNTVRAHIRSYKNREARLYVVRSDDNAAFICKAPCKADVVVGTTLRVTYGDDSEGHDFTMEGTPGTDVDLEVRPASKGALIGGIVMASTGGAVALIGLLLVAVSKLSNNESDTRTAGWVTTGVGASLAIGGVVLIASRSREPRLKQTEHTPSPYYAKDAPSRVAFDAPPRDAPSLTPAAFTPLTIGFQF